MFAIKGLIPQITLPTRFSRKKATLIDHIFSKFPTNCEKSNSGIIVTKLSDHLPYFAYAEILKAKNKPQNL